MKIISASLPFRTPIVYIKKYVYKTVITKQRVIFFATIVADYQLELNSWVHVCVSQSDELDKCLTLHCLK